MSPKVVRARDCGRKFRSQCSAKPRNSRIFLVGRVLAYYAESYAPRMTKDLTCIALRAGQLAAALLVAVSVGCTTKPTVTDAPSAPDAGSHNSVQVGQNTSVRVGVTSEVTPPGSIGGPSAIEDPISLFAAHYEQRLGAVELKHRAIPGGEEITLSSSKLKGPGNEPQLLIHSGGATKDVVVLCHGLSDSPYYMRAIGDRLFIAGANVVLPLLPAHGLIDPDEAMEDDHLDRKWVVAFDHAVRVAERLGDRISLGGFSTGGTLSVRKALSAPERIDGGLFLFAAALSVGNVNENLAWSAFLVPWIAKRQDGEYVGRGPNPYKYPKFPQFGGLELIDVIHDVNRMLDAGGGPKQPIFAVHSIHDEAAIPQGTGKLLRADGVRGVAIVLAANPPLEHARLVLAEDIELDPVHVREGETPPIPRANPSFQRMMELALTFFENLSKNVEKPAKVGSDSRALRDTSNPPR